MPGHQLWIVSSKKTGDFTKNTASQGSGRKDTGPGLAQVSLRLEIRPSNFLCLHLLRWKTGRNLVHCLSWSCQHIRGKPVWKMEETFLMQTARGPPK